MDLHAYDRFSLDLLRKDLGLAIEGWDWSKGAYGHSLSLPARDDIHPLGQDHFNNLPFANVLKNCPYFYEIFEGFKCEKVSFRLLRRMPKTSYSWHTDKDKGPSVVRLQIPVVTNDESYLVVTDYDRYEEFRGLDRRLSEEEAFEAFELFKEANKGHYKEYVLQPGILYYFNTNKFHTLLNFGKSERITLVMDFEANDWLKNRYPEIKGEINGTER